MPETYAEQAIILNRRPFRGYDYSVSAYTRGRGKVQLVAKGALRPQSKLASHLEPLTLVEMMIISGRVATVGGVVSRDCYVHCKEDLDKMLLASRATSRASSWLREHEADEQIFFLFHDFLHLLNQRRSETSWYQLMGNIFLYKILTHLGYGLDTDVCQHCGKNIVGTAVFSLHDHGLLCLDCQKGNSTIQVSRPLQERIKQYSTESISTVADIPVYKKDIEPLIKVLEMWIRYMDEELRGHRKTNFVSSL